MEIRRINSPESKLVVELFNQYRILYHQPAGTEGTKEFIPAGPEENEFVVFVAFKNSIPVGFTQLYPVCHSAKTTKNWILHDLYVDPSFHKQGISKKLIHAAMDFVKNSGDAKSTGPSAPFRAQ